MNASITTMKDPEGNVLYPKTKTDAIYDGSSNRLDQILTSIQGDLGSKSSASAVAGNDAFSKISTLNSELTDRLVNRVTGNNSKTFGTLIQELFTGVSGNYQNYYIKWGQRYFRHSEGKEYYLFSAGDTAYNNMLVRIINADGGYYEANGTLTLTNYSSSSAGTATLELYKISGYQ